MKLYYFKLWLKRRYCNHKIGVKDIHLTDIKLLPEPLGTDYRYAKEWERYYSMQYKERGHTMRAVGICRKCGHQEYGHCGLNVITYPVD